MDKWKSKLKKHGKQASSSKFLNFYRTLELRHTVLRCLVAILFYLKYVIVGLFFPETVLWKRRLFRSAVTQESTPMVCVPLLSPFQLTFYWWRLIPGALGLKAPSPGVWQLLSRWGSKAADTSFIFPSTTSPLHSVQPTHLGCCEQVLFPLSGATLEVDVGNEIGIEITGKPGQTRRHGAKNV